MTCLDGSDCCDARDIDHEYGPVELARFTGNPHRKCLNCHCVSLDLEEEDT